MIRSGLARIERGDGVVPLRNQAIKYSVYDAEAKMLPRIDDVHWLSRILREEREAPWEYTAVSRNGDWKREW